MTIQQNLPFTVENFNRMVESLNVDHSHHSDIKKDWRAFISSRFTLSENQNAFFGGLPRKSILTIQRAFMSIIRDGGEMYLKHDLTTESIDVVCERIAIFRPQIKPIVICRFDGFFKNCRWFPKDQSTKSK